MNVKLKLVNWKIGENEDKKQVAPIISGDYKIKCGAKTIAKQSFNSGYGSIDFPFSSELISKIEELQKEIAKEIETTIT